MVVLAILGLLTAIAVPPIMHYLEVAKINTAKTEISNLSAGLDLYKIDIGHYPTTQEGLDALMKAPPGAENWTGPYVKKINALNDPWGHPYHYRSPGEHGDFDIYSNGAKADSSEAGTPTVANW